MTNLDPRRRRADNMVLTLILGVFSLMGACAPSPTTPDSNEYPIECVLAAQDAYGSGEPVQLRFTLRNGADQNVYFLKWYTPFEAFAGEIFLVERDGVPVPYQGVLAKRGAPGREDYLALAPEDQATILIDLSTAYDLSQEGQYRVEFISHLYDFTQDEALIPRNEEAHQPFLLHCNDVEFRIKASAE